MNDGNLSACRKCGTLNRIDNTYCRKCGAVLEVRTSEIRAQPKPVRPRFEGIRWRYVIIGVFVMVGLVSFLSVVSFIAAGALGMGIDNLTRDLVQVSIITTAAFFVAFGIGGMVLSRLARQPIPREVALSTVLVMGAFGVIGSIVTSDLVIVAGVILVPSLASAVLGARLTKTRGAGER